jgi:hypothetical protein
VTVEIDDDKLGLEGTFPRPGWTVLDAVRDRRFTGEVVFDTLPEIRLYADRGNIYLAERSSDPSLGARLVDAGALNATQLEHGAVRIGDSEHLGRLFERVPSVDRHAVLVTTELMTEECVGWLASQRVDDVHVTPYRHHPSGAHRWDRPFELAEPAPGDPLPAPPPGQAPLLHTPPAPIAPPEPLFTQLALDDADDMIRWDQPSYLDERLTPIDIAGRLAALREADEAERIGIQPITVAVPGNVDEVTIPEVPVGVAADGDDVSDAANPASREPAETPATAADQDWIDRLDTAGLPEPGSDPLASPIRLSQLPAEPIDRFELIWPSGDIDEQFGSTISEPFPHPDMDRPGPTARLVRGGAVRATSATVSPPEPEPVVAEQSGTTVVDDELERWLADEDQQEAITDEVVLAVRRAVASIETGSLAARRRLSETPAGELNGESYGQPSPLPGRIALRSESDSVTVGRATPMPGSSVFDKLPLAETSGPIDDGENAGPLDAPEVNGTNGEVQRTSALRRLIGSLRRR